VTLRLRQPAMASAGGGHLAPEQRGLARRVEEVDLVERDVECDDIARVHVPLRGDDRDDVHAGDDGVEELLVAEVLHDVRLRLGRRLRSVGGVDVEVLRTDSKDVAAPGGRPDGVPEGGWERHGEAFSLCLLYTSDA